MIEVQKLKSLRFFDQTPSSSLTSLAGAMHSFRYQKGDVILKEGEKGDALYLIASGAVAVHKKLSGSTGVFKRVARLGVGEVFGMMSFFDQSPVSATVVSEEETEVFTLPFSALREWLAKEPMTAVEFALVLLGGLSSYLRQTTDELVAIFEIARLLGVRRTVTDLTQGVLDVLSDHFGEETSIGVFVWNPYNEEFDRVGFTGSAASWGFETIGKESPLIEKAGVALLSMEDLSQEIGDRHPWTIPTGHLLVSPIVMLQKVEGLILFYNPQPRFFSRGTRHLVETVSSALAPAFSSARNREEEAAKKRYEERRSGSFWI